MGLLAAKDPLIIVPPNSAPEWVSTPAPSFVGGVGGTYALSTVSSDAEGDTLTYTLNGASVIWPSGWSMSSAGLITVTAGAAEGSTAGMIVDLDDGTASLVPSSSFPAVVTGASSKRWTPGNYIKPQGDPFDGTTQASFLSTMSSQLSNQAEQIPEIKGIMFPIPWGWVNTTGSTFDWTFLDAMSAQAQSQGKQWAVLLHYKSFLWLNNAPPDPLDPKTVEAPADLLASNVVQQNQGWIATLWEVAVMDRFIACLEAIAARYDNDPSFEAILLPEAVPSFGGIGAPPGYDINVYSTQLQRCYTAMAAAFTKTNVMPQINSLSGNIENLFEKAYDLNIGIGAPDARETPGWLFFAGAVGGGETPPRDYREQVARCATVSSSTFSKTSRTEAEVIDFIQLQKASHVWWITSTGTGYSWTGIKAAIQADPNVWTTCPTRYGSCEV